MASETRRARDHALLDAVDAFGREPFSGTVWRLAREGRDPVAGNRSDSRWCNATFDILYTSLEQDGAVAEIHALLSLQPVFPSRTAWFAHELAISARVTLKLADLPALARLGVDTARFKNRDYKRTQEIADAAYFLGFDGLIAPSARWPCDNAMFFTERLAPDQIALVGKPELIDWKKHMRRRGR